MTKSRKRLIIRLAIFSVIVGLGVLAFVQTKYGLVDSSAGKTPEENGDNSNTGDGTDSNDQPAAAEDLMLIKAPPPQPQIPPTSPFPAPPAETVVRANGGNEFAPTVAPPVQTSFADIDEDITGNQVPSLPVNPFPANNLRSNAADGTFVSTEAPARPPINTYAQTSGQLSPTELTLPDANAPSGFAPVANAAPPISSIDPHGNSSESQNNSSGQGFDDRPIGLPSRSSASNLPSGTSGGIGFSDSPLNNSSNATASTPGPKELDGPQAPSIVLQKEAPAEIQVGKPAMFRLKVKNIGQVEAKEVVVLDRIPEGTEFVDSSPEPTRAPDGSLAWKLGTLKPGADAVVALQLIPTAEGEIGSVATVSFQAQASARSICTKPVLTIEHNTPEQVLIGQPVTLEIKVTNNGSGVATKVVVEDDVPEHLSHPAGSELEYELGSLRPGESRELKLTLQAKKAGIVESVLIVRGDGNLIDRNAKRFEVIAPELQVSLSGPTRRYLERQATYTVSVKNPGTATANNIDLVTFLPKGLKFVSTNNQGQYNPQNHAVYWSLVELPSQQTGEVELTALPIEMGEQKLRVESKADLGLAGEHEQTVLVEGLAAIFFGVADTADPIEVGSDTVYQVQVVNQGSKTATDVRVSALLPRGLRPIGGDGPTTYRIENDVIVFEPLARLAPKDEKVFKIQARGEAEGDHRIRVQIVTNEVRSPVTKEESTRVYVDR